jgi:molecular chaperone GrpE
MNTYERHDKDVTEDVTTECCGGCQDSDEVADNDVHNADDVDVQDNASRESEELMKCQQDVAVWKDKYVRITADFENLRRRTYKEQEQALWRAQADIIAPLLAVIDNFDRALDDIAKRTTQEESQSTLSGMALIRKELASLCERAGVQEMVPTEHFDPSQHEALASIDSSTHTQGNIVQIFQKGYLLKGQVLRPAKVSVAR